jgi:hypothetical protein
MTQLGGMVSSKPFIAGMSGFDFYYFFLISSKPVISDLRICYLRDILKNMECHKDRF